MPIEPAHYAVFGNPVSHSLSPRIHTLFAAQTAQAMRYAAICPPLDGFAAAVAEFAAQGGRGANVTLPFKEEAFRLAQDLTPRAEAAGAVKERLPSGRQTAQGEAQKVMAVPQPVGAQGPGGLPASEIPSGAASK